MTRRSAGFVSKKAHKKSRGGCSTCKKKKVKCDEALPRCAYCALRKLECTYNYPSTQPRKWQSLSPEQSEYSTPPTSARESPDVEPFNAPNLQLAAALSPKVQTSSGELSSTDIELLHFFRAETWRRLSVREDDTMSFINREWLPQMSIKQPFLLYALLTVTAGHRNSVMPSDRMVRAATVYRQKTFEAYNKALSNISNDNYEALLVTSAFMQVLVPPPSPPGSDDAVLDWIFSFLHVVQGIRLLAALKWDTGIEKLTVFPMFKREIATLPPPPMLQSLPDQYLNPRPEPVNPPATYTQSEPSTPKSSGLEIDLSNLPFRPKELPRASSANPRRRPEWSLPAPAFLPPPLMALLRSIADPLDTGPIDLHRATLLPVLHALSPLFLSLYHYHLSKDIYVRIVVYPTFILPEFISLVKAREPRALVIVAWWTAFMCFPPNAWWPSGTIPRVLQAVSNAVMRSNTNTAVLMRAVEGACKLVRTFERQGKEAAAKSVFQGWEGVYWDMGGKADEHAPGATGRAYEDDFRDAYFGSGGRNKRSCKESKEQIGMEQMPTVHSDVFASSEVSGNQDVDDDRTRWRGY